MMSLFEKDKQLGLWIDKLKRYEITIHNITTNSYFHVFEAAYSGEDAYIRMTELIANNNFKHAFEIVFVEERALTDDYKILVYARIRDNNNPNRYLNLNNDYDYTIAKQQISDIIHLWHNQAIAQFEWESLHEKRN